MAESTLIPTKELGLLPRLRIVLDRFRDSLPFQSLVASLNSGLQPHIKVSGLSGSSESILISLLSDLRTSPILIVTAKAETANDLYDDLLFLLGPELVGHYPARQILPYDFKAPVGEIMGRRISTLSALSSSSLKVVVAPMRAILEPTISREELEQSRIELKVGTEIEIDSLITRLVNLGFRNVPLVEEVGDFAKRGGLVDFFSPGADAPVRIEFFGDEVDTIRQFDVSTQRTIGQLTHVRLLPKREISISHEDLEAHLDRLPESDADFIRNRYLRDPELPGLEWLSLLFGMKHGSFLEYFPLDGLIVSEQTATLEKEAEEIIDEARSLCERLSEKLTKLPQPEEYYQNKINILNAFRAHPQIEILPFRGVDPTLIYFDCQPHPALGSRLDLLADTLREYQTLGIASFIATDNVAQAQRLQELLAEKVTLEPKPVVEAANLSGGFVSPGGKFAILTDHEIFHRYHRRVRKKKFREGVAISDYHNLNRGDYVVHNDFGIARYLGLETIHVDDRNRDCLLLQYYGTDRLFVPIEEFNRVGKYSGSENAPELTRLGGPGWDKLKEKTQKAIADMADDLIVLYAERKARLGYAFSPDSVFMRQLEASFPYDETPDQEKAIADVKRDMEMERAMDRLICGDVGYGKTEVAIRAAFKAIDDGKQVAILVPTTILAQQHYATFSERLSDFAASVDLLSRFRTKKEQLETVQKLAEGKVDLVIGTHRLLSGDIEFKDLGLLIIDEEHRFGVKHKEALRRLRSTVDTLAMTATPIPRTLQMALSGVRDMSLITTSPKDRLPIITEIVEFDASIINMAVLREIDRGGQVFFVHNRVQTIDAMYEYLKELLPKAEIGIAHGQMHERSLEGIMLAFMAGHYQVLLCTSIIESGLDIPRANTIIINRADKFGLAQLYQLRGRVGRSARRAYAYLLTPEIKTLQVDAMKRLRALEAHADLGSGFALAMRDLEIRGAGTLLGAKQSGFIEEIGFDLYNKLLEETIAKLKGEELVKPPDTKFELDLETYLAEDYIPDSQQKVDIYRRLADAAVLDDVIKITEEVADRFGRAPQSAINLFDATAVKVVAAQLGAEKVKMRSGRVNIFFKEDKKLSRAEIEALRKGTDAPMEFSLVPRPTVMVDFSGIAETDRLNAFRQLLEKTQIG
ncbi:MAG: transcription-repair coupling factor [candidate division Zixibacteria bacterium]|nr:transcription-repair coupling factor [candidate division Zixibacteria bacterium]